MDRWTHRIDGAKTCSDGGAEANSDWVDRSGGHIEPQNSQGISCVVVSCVVAMYCTVKLS